MCVIVTCEFSGYPSYWDIHWIYSVSMVSSAAVQCDRTTVEITYNVCNWNRWIQWLSKLLGDPLNTLSTVSMVNSVAVEGGKTSLKLPPMCKLKQVNSVDIQVYRTSTEYTLWAWWIQWLSNVIGQPLKWPTMFVIEIGEFSGYPRY